MNSLHQIANTVQTVEHDAETGLLLWVEDDAAPAWQPTTQTAGNLFSELLEEIRKGNGPQVTLTDADLAAADRELLYTDWRS